MNLQPALFGIFRKAPQQQAAANAQSHGYTLARPEGKDADTIAITRLPIAAICAAIVCFAVSGCSFFGKTPEAIVPPAPIASAVPAKPTALSPAAQSALSQARRQVAIATERAALWPNASQLLKQAEAAAIQFDSFLTAKLADEVSALCAASVKQASYAPLQAW